MAQHPVIGYVIWAVLFGALFAWEGLALSLSYEGTALTDPAPLTDATNLAGRLRVHRMAQGSISVAPPPGLAGVRERFCRGSRCRELVIE